LAEIKPKWPFIGPCSSSQFHGLPQSRRLPALVRTLQHVDVELADLSHSNCLGACIGSQSNNNAILVFQPVIGASEPVRDARIRRHSDPPARQGRKALEWKSSSGAQPYSRAQHPDRPARVTPVPAPPLRIRQDHHHITLPIVALHVL
jgi:hypothetical protein